MSIHNICLHGEIRKIFFQYLFLSGSMPWQEKEYTRLNLLGKNFCWCMGWHGNSHTVFLSGVIALALYIDFM